MPKRQYPKGAPRLAFANTEPNADQVPRPDEEGFTVRLGKKWRTVCEDLGQDHVVVLNGEGKPVCEARINYLNYVRLEDVQSSQMPKGIADRGHLQQVLSAVYGRLVDPNEYVTVLHYTAF